MAFTFGSTAPTANSTSSAGFGHQRSNTPLFTPASGAQPTGTGVPGINTAGGFGATATQNQPSIGGIGNLFSNANQSSSGLPNTSTATSQPANGFLTGSAGATSAPSQMNSLFGSAVTNAPANKSASTGIFGSSTSGLAGSNNAQNLFASKAGNMGFSAKTQPQEQHNSLLSLPTVFPDTSVPYFVITPNKVERHPVTSNMFEKEPKSQAKDLDFDATATLHIGGRRTTLPGFLTTAQSPANTRGRQQKRNIDNKQNLRFTDAGNGSTKNEGIFGGAMGDGGFSNRSRIRANEDTTVEEVPPTASLWDIGVNPRKYAGICDLDVTPQTDLWTASVMEYSRTSSSKAKATSVTDRPQQKLQSPSSGSPGQTETIVRVFGFPSDQKTAVIRYFSQLGYVKERFQSTNNWITFRYMSGSDAKKALACHGQLVGNNCRVGVMLAKTMSG